MPTKLTAKERLKIVEKALAGENVSKLCKEHSISRTLLYRWIKRYKEQKGAPKIHALKPKQTRERITNVAGDSKVKIILELIKKDPGLSVAKLASKIPLDDNNKPIVGPHGIQIVLEKLDLNTYERRLEFQKADISIESFLEQKYRKPEQLEIERTLRPQDRLEMIERVKLGENVARVCQLYKVSRPVFYKWLKRYKEAPEGQKLEALWDQKPKIERYYNQAPEEVEQAVLAAAREYPELSTHRLVWVLPQVGGRPILGNHGVQNILERNNLSTYELRLAFAEDYRKPTVSTHFFRALISVLIRVANQEARQRSFTVKAGFVSAFAIFLGVVAYGTISLGQLILGAPSVLISVGMIFSLFSLTVGMFFFAYSLKYYITIATVLSFSRNSGGNKTTHYNNVLTKSGSPRKGIGLSADLKNITLDRSPFVSIHMATYNEKKVVDRLLTAATSQEYENYEVILADDSNDETVEIIKKWESHPRVKIVHRPTREGYKGGALQFALNKTDPRAEFVIVFDADFIPYPDTITQFLKYFKSTVGSLNPSEYRKSKVGVIQGYQWHVLNKSENWITRGVRTEYSGSYVIERSGIEIYGGLKQISGSVYMMRKDVIKSIGWGTSITEDFELTLRMYEKGYKVVYTPYIQAPAEAVSTIKRLIRQRMRWAEGHSHNVKKMFSRLMFSPNLTRPEKLEFLYLSPYYLQSFLFLVGTFSWFLAEAVFGARLPFWTSTWGWSLVFTNLLSLPLMNMVGLFLEESDEKDYLGIFSFVVLSYIVAPFQGYASVKGFFEKEEGPWFRTPKTGKITDVFTPGRFYKLIFGVFGKKAGSKQAVPASANLGYNIDSNYLSLTSAHNKFQKHAAALKRVGWVARSAIAFLLVFTITLLYSSRNVKLVYATNWASPLQLTLVSPGDGTWPSWGNIMNTSTSYSTSGGTVVIFNNGTANKNTNNYTFYTNLLPTGSDSATVPSGAYYIQIARTSGTAKNSMNIAMQLLLTNNNGTAKTQLLWTSANVSTVGANPNTVIQGTVGTLGSSSTITSSAKNRLAFRLSYINGNQTTTTSNLVFNTNNGTNGNRAARLVLPADLTVPEIPKKALFLLAVVIMPLAPALIHARLRRKNKNMVEEIRADLDDLIRKLLGKDEEFLDDLPV